MHLEEKSSFHCPGQLGVAGGVLWAGLGHKTPTGGWKIRCCIFAAWSAHDRCDDTEMFCFVLPAFEQKAEWWEERHISLRKKRGCLCFCDLRFANKQASTGGDSPLLSRVCSQQRHASLLNKMQETFVSPYPHLHTHWPLITALK